MRNGCVFSPKCVSTLTERVQGGVDQGARSGPDHLSLHLRADLNLLNLKIHFDCAGSHKVVGLDRGRCAISFIYCTVVTLQNRQMHFDCTGSHKVVG